MALVLTLPAGAQAQIGGLPLPPLPPAGLPGLPPSGRLLPDEPPRPRPSRRAPKPPQAPRVLEKGLDVVSQVPAGPLASAGESLVSAVGETRRRLVDRLLREHPLEVEADPQGEPVVRGEILALAPSADTLARAAAAGFAVNGRERIAGLELETATLRSPPGMSVGEAMRQLRAVAPEGQFEFNHIYQPSGRLAAETGRPSSRGARGGGVQVGLVDGSVATDHPAFAGARITQQAFAPGGAKVSPHATAVGSLLVGSAGRFRGAVPGARLMVADVYGPTAAGGSAQAIARGLGWLAQTRTPVIDISLVGPNNLILAAAVRALTAKGHLIVAAVGNDGPAAPPLYPAAYAGVVAVTGVDDRRRVLPEAGRGGHVDFAAPGAQMAAAGVGGGFVSVRGTSFAAPLAAGALATLLPTPDVAGASRALAALGRRAEDLGAHGADPIYGRGLVAFDLRTDPAAVGARALALRAP